MLKLMKYEIRKTMFTKLIILGVTALVEAIYLIALFTDAEDTLTMTIGLLVMLAFGSVMVIGLESVITLHRDMNTKQSYMLFMTPHSSYTILGAKVLENGLSILLTGAFFFALGMLDVSLLFAKQGQLNQIWEMFQSFIQRINEEITLTSTSMAALFFNLLAGWICTVTTAYLADVVSCALLNGKKMNGAVSFVLFLALSYGTAKLASLLVGGLSTYEARFLADGLISLVFAAVMYVVTAQIMERRLSV